MKQFIVRMFSFISLVVTALKSNAAHQRQLFYVSRDYHKPWWTLLKGWGWIHIPIRGLWAVAGDHTWSLPLDRWEGDSEEWSTYCAHLAELMNEDQNSYYWVVKTQSGGVPWPMVRKFYR